MPLPPAPLPSDRTDATAASAVGLQARLPNGVAIDLDGLDPSHLAAVIETLGRLRCSVSTKG